MFLEFHVQVFNFNIQKKTNVFYDTHRVYQEKKENKTKVPTELVLNPRLKTIA